MVSCTQPKVECSVFNLISMRTDWHLNLNGNEVLRNSLKINLLTAERHSPVQMFKYVTISIIRAACISSESAIPCLSQAELMKVKPEGLNLNLLVLLHSKTLNNNTIPCPEPLFFMMHCKTLLIYEITAFSDKTLNLK